MKNSNSIINLISIGLILFFLLVSDKISLYTSITTKQIILYFIWLLIIFISVKYINKDKAKEFGFTFKNKVSKKVKRNSILIGLLLGILMNVFIFYSIEFTEYLKGLNIIEKISFAIILGPIMEEIVFRGYIQTVFGFILVKYKRNNIFWLPVIVTSIIFGFLHFTAIKAVSLQQTTGIVFLATMLGLCSGYFKEKYKSLVPPIYMHIATNFGGIIVVTLLIVGSTSTVRHKILKRMNQPEYHFNMNDSTSFRNDLNYFSIYEKNLPDSFIGNYKNISVRIYLKVDTTGKINEIILDTIMNMDYKKIINKEFYRQNALEVVKKLPRFIPPDNLKNDTTIVFYLAY